ncbi:MAG: UdgX family uracil-DNA binding protein [Actinomycetota bacterium]|nr:UdgX family uracil-DNA binding protein [Actinomycetota bacterium]
MSTLLDAPSDRPQPPVPKRPSLPNMRSAVEECRACDLWEGATQGVMGEGARNARLMLVGEQPGDREDIEGHPFLGPAGGVLDRGLERAGIARDEVYITNVVKHFRYKARGKQRIHQKPDRWHVRACAPWLEAELEMIRPDALVCLGATAGQALLGPHVRIGHDRGRPIESDLAELVTLTTHPSAVLRSQAEEQREAAMEQFVADLAKVAAWLKRHSESKR